MTQALHFGGSGEGEKAIGRTRVNAVHFGNGEEATIRTQEIMMGIGKGTPIRRKSATLDDAQGKASRFLFDFVHFVDDFVPKARYFLDVKTEDEHSDIELKSETEK